MFEMYSHQVPTDAIETDLSQAVAAMFPRLDNVIYLDNAATTMKPLYVLKAQESYYRNLGASPHRGVYKRATQATALYEKGRQVIKDFFALPEQYEVIFTQGATESLNLLAHGLQWLLGTGDSIVLTTMEHHANLVPWQEVARQTGASLRFITLDEHGQLDMQQAEQVIDASTRVVAFTSASNVLGTVNPIHAIAKLAKKFGAFTIVDAAQSVGHMPTDYSEADAFVFSAHKCYGPQGIGALVGQRELLEQLQPLKFGGGMIDTVALTSATYAPIPARLEAGTPNVAGIAGLIAALEVLSEIGLETVQHHEQALVKKTMDGLSLLSDIEILGSATHRTGLVSFVDHRIHAHDLATILDEYTIAVRAGHHCAQPLHKLLGHQASVRASFAPYNSQKDVDALLRGISNARNWMGVL